MKTDKETRNLNMIDRLIRILFLVSMSVVAGICCFGSGISYAGKKSFESQSVVWFLLGIAFVCVLGGISFFAGRAERKEHPRRDAFFVLSVSFLWFCISLIAAHFYYFQSGWDVMAVVSSAEAIARGQFEAVNNGYFSLCPNNAFLTCFFSWIIKLGMIAGYGNPYFSLIAFQCLAVSAAGAVSFFAVLRLSADRRIAYLSWFFFLILCGCSPWVSVPYTDVVGVLFTALVLYLYASDRLPFLFGFLLITGYYIKPCVLIFGIAATVVSAKEYLSFLKTDRKKLVKPALIAAGMLLGFLFVKVSIPMSHIRIDSEKTLGVAHFVMMGLNEGSNGVVNPEDTGFSVAIEDPRERTLENLRVAGERLQTMGIWGMAKHTARKILTSFNDGTFSWWVEGQFFSQQIWTGHPDLEELFRSFFYPEGGNYRLFRGIVQSLWMGVLLLCICGGVFGKEKTACVMQLTLIGALFFELFFEPRARHLINVLPVFFYLASIGFWRTMDALKGLRKKAGK